MYVVFIIPSREMPRWFTILLAKLIITFETSWIIICFIGDFEQGHKNMGSPRKLPSWRMERMEVSSRDRVYAQTIYCTYTSRYFMNYPSCWSSENTFRNCKWAVCFSFQVKEYSKLTAGFYLQMLHMISHHKQLHLNLVFCYHNLHNMDIHLLLLYSRLPQYQCAHTNTHTYICIISFI